MTQTHPITPPPALVASLCASAPHGIRGAVITREIWLVNHAYRAGADQELEACAQWVEANFGQLPTHNLHQFRRPKPPSLKKQAYDALDTYIYGEPDPKDKERTYNTIRRALEALDD